MNGRHEIIVENRRIRYRFSVSRNITILKGDSATGKTTMIEMIEAYQQYGEDSGVTIRSDVPCVTVSQQYWEIELRKHHRSVIFIDEGASFVRSKEFAQTIEHSDNYFVIATRNPLFELPYSTKEVYGIKNTSGNRYQGTKRIYAEFYPLNEDLSNPDGMPDLVVIEDTNAGFEFYSAFFSRREIRCISAGGKSSVYQTLREEEYNIALVIVDGAAFGPEIENVLSLRNARKSIILLPESFEWLILQANLLKDHEVQEILEDPSAYISSEVYFSWERYFTALLIAKSQNTWMAYNKRKINQNLLQERVMNSIIEQLPGWDEKLKALQEDRKIDEDSG